MFASFSRHNGGWTVVVSLADPALAIAWRMGESGEFKDADGKTIDMSALKLRNETERAVGNMKVNARGDMIDDMNRVISSKTDQVNKQYNKQTTPRK